VTTTTKTMNTTTTSTPTEPDTLLVDAYCTACRLVITEKVSALSDASGSAVLPEGWLPDGWVRRGPFHMLCVDCASVSLFQLRRRMREAKVALARAENAMAQAQLEAKIAKDELEETERLLFSFGRKYQEEGYGP